MIAEADIQSMNPQERREAMSLLRNSFDEIPEEDSESPAWHEAVLMERLRKLDAGESKLYTLEQCRSMFDDLKASERSCCP